MTLIAISHYIEAKFNYGYFIPFLHCGSKILHKKFQVILSKNEGVTLIAISDYIEAKFNYGYFINFFYVVALRF